MTDYFERYMHGLIITTGRKFWLPGKFSTLSSTGNGIYLLCLSMLFCGSAFASNYPPVSVSMQAIKVSAHVYYVSGTAGIATDNEGFVSNSAFIVTDEGVVVFDTLGSPSLAVKLLQVIRKITDLPVVRVYISHYHADHIYGAQIFEELGAEIVAPDGSSDYLQSDVAIERLQERRNSLGPWVNSDTRLVEPDRYLLDEESFELAGVKFRVLNVGSAHSEGDLVMWIENEKILLSGDIIFEGRIPYLGSTNTARWLEVLQNMQSQDVEAIIPGHGQAASDPLKLIKLTFDYLFYVRQKMANAVENWIPFDQAYDEVDWAQFIEFPAFFEANRRNAYSVYLSLEEEALQ